MPSVKHKRIKRQKRYAQNKDAAKLYKKKKDLIQLSKNEYYNSNEYKIENSKKVKYEGNKDAKRQYYVENKDARRQYYVENKDDKKLYYEENKDAIRQYYEEKK